MKPGMQREMLVAYWLLFDEFALDPTDPPDGERTPQEKSAAGESASSPPSSERT